MKYIKLMTSLSVACCFASAATEYPTLNTGFESGPNNAVINDLDEPFQTIYSNEQAKDGSYSAKLTIDGGSDGWGQFGFREILDPKLDKGSDIWLSLDMFVPNSFSLETNFSLKFLRFHIATNDNQHLGYIDIYINRDGTFRYQSELYASQKVVINDFNPGAISNQGIVGAESGQTYDVFRTKKALNSTQGSLVIKKKGEDNLNLRDGEELTSGGQRVGYVSSASSNSVVTPLGENFDNNIKTVQKGQWENYIFHIRFSDDNPKVEFRKNCHVLFQTTSDPTLINASDLVYHFLLFTYWNGHAPQTQSLYIDNFRLSSQPPTNCKTPNAPDAN